LHNIKEISVGTPASLTNFYFGITLAPIPALTHSQMRFRVLISLENSAGTLACLGNGLIGTKLANQLAILRLHQKCKGRISQDNFVGILVRQKASIYIGMELVCQPARVH